MNTRNKIKERFVINLITQPIIVRIIPEETAMPYNIVRHKTVYSVFDITHDTIICDCDTEKDAELIRNLLNNNHSKQE